MTDTAMQEQAIWETPGRIAIILGIVGLVAGVVGFWLGQRDVPPAPQIINIHLPSCN
jgi:hypothetical protein